MTERIAETSARPRARIIGVVYLFYFLTAVFGEVFLKGLAVDGNAAATASNILAHQPLFRLGLATGLIATVCYVALTALFYDLFKHVNRSLSLLAAFFSLVGCAVGAFSDLFHLAPLVVLGGARYLSVFTVEQRQALALMFLRLQAQAYNISFVFFGLHCLLIGCLILRSTFLPRIVGALMAFAGLGWLTLSFASLLSPPLAGYLVPYIMAPGALGEGSLTLWLLVMGVNVERWKEQARGRRPGREEA